MKKKNNKGFTLIELLGVITILGILMVIGIVGFSNLIGKAKDTQLSQQKKTLTMAAESYASDNNSQLPKEIGESRNISIQTLKGANYIRESIKNSKGESCMTNSYVRVYKLSKTEYTYTAFLYCGSDPVPSQPDLPEPTVKVYFSDSTGRQNVDDVFNNVNKAYVFFELTGGKDPDTGEEYELDGFSFAILAKLKGQSDVNEVYNSGSISAQREKTFTYSKPLKDYIDITDVSYFEIKVSVHNVIGGEKVLTTSESQSAGKNFQDKVPPTCVLIENQSDENSWINKSTPESERYRTVTVGCDDNGDKGSGCIRTTFSKTWPNNDQTTGAEFDYIQVKDNAGNVNLPDSYVDKDNPCGGGFKNDACRVRVNVDLSSPVIELDAFKSNASHNNSEGASVLADNSLKKAQDGAEIQTINTSNYTGNVNGWMNSSKFPNGVIFKVKVYDNMHLDTVTWETNKTLISDVNSSTYKNVSVTNPDGDFKTIASNDLDANNCGDSTVHDYYFVLTGEGRRYAVLTARDKAGNETKYIIYADLDITAPPVPILSAKMWKSISDSTLAGNYSYGRWSSVPVDVSIPNTYAVDNLSQNNVSLSGFNTFQYQLKLASASNFAKAVSAQSYVFGQGQQGKNAIRFRGCDKAGNCSAYSGDSEVWIDTTAPTCNVTAVDNSNNTYSGGWLKQGQSATVTATCVESASNSASGCIEDGDIKKTYTYTYNSNINTTTASAKGDNIQIFVKDGAGNQIECAYKTVRIDHNPPTCTYSGENSTWSTANRTLRWGCNDTGGSNCVKSEYGSTTFSSGVVSTWNLASFNISDNAGNTVTCGKTMNVYLDKVAPTCSVSKTSINTTAGVSANVTCADQGVGSVSGCPGTKTGLKSTASYTLKDSLGNTSTCSIPVSSYKLYTTRTRGCASYYRCAAAGCAAYNQVCCSGQYYADRKLLWHEDSKAHCIETLGGICEGFHAYWCHDCVTYSAKYCHKYCNGTCKTYNAGSACGCYSFTAWSAWSGYSYTSCTGGTYRECSGATFYQ